MFLEFFNWFCNCLSSIFNTMKEFELFTGFTYYNLFIALLAIPIFIKIFNFIMGIEDEEYYSNNYTTVYKSQYDSKRRGDNR